MNLFKKFKQAKAGHTDQVHGAAHPAAEPSLSEGEVLVQDVPAASEQTAADGRDVVLTESTSDESTRLTQRLGGWFRRARGTGDDAPKPGGFSRTERRRPRAVPIRVLIGFLPDVSERDARDYALAIAEKTFAQPALAYYDAYPYDNGYAYEVHEGGNGEAYLPSILRYFREQGPYVPGEDVKVVIRTGTRLVEVERARVGLSAILLPESATAEPTPWLEPSDKLTPALNQRTGFLAVGATFFITGFFALIIGSMLTRYQPYEPPPKPLVATVSYESLPISQWPRLQNLAPNSYVAKLVYEDKRWQRPEIRNVETPPTEPAPAATAATAEVQPEHVVDQPAPETAPPANP